jgi:predicted ribosome quality control (RQC) complex YloA/Tae2 family protein
LFAFVCETGDERRVASKGRPFRRLEIEGFEVLIGKGAKENDQLSLEIAEPNDIWLHAAGSAPGSHVVIRNPDATVVPRSVIEAAAEHAAWYSRARHHAKAEVHYCSAANVSKPRGAPAGLVEIRRHSSIRVIPRPVPS